jgi:hypothetical protein
MGTMLNELCPKPNVISNGKSACVHQRRQLREARLSGPIPQGESMSLLFRKRNKQEVADYDEGFKVGSDSKVPDEDKSFAWQREWAEAQE